MNEWMMKHIQEVKLAYVEELLALEDVHCVAIGHKSINNIQTDTMSIVVFTTHKKPLCALKAYEVIPAFLQDIPTDVIESPRFEPYRMNTNQTIPNRQKYRPIPGGVEIYMPSSPFTGSVCTLGMYVHSLRAGDPYDDIYLLANAHCFYHPDQVIFQPASNNTEDRIAYATRTVNSEYADAGIGYMLNQADAQTDFILGIGVPKGQYDVTDRSIGQAVIKSGRTTGVTIGTLAYLHADAEDKKDQIIIVDRDDVTFSDHGDSGSVVLMNEGEHDHEVIGLLWGGALIYTILSPIQDVLDELEVELIFAPNVQ